jgi:hypothetical protein
MMGSVVIAHDGSYMASKATDLCLAGVVPYCRTSKKWLKASVSEWSNAASNYHGKLIGALMLLLILRAPSTTFVHLS